MSSESFWTVRETEVRLRTSRVQRTSESRAECAFHWPLTRDVAGDCGLDAREPH